MSLTNTATVTRKLIIGLGVLVGGSLFLLIAFNIGSGVYKSFFPDKPPPPLVAFGKLPPLLINEGFKPNENVTYKLETVTGELKELASDLKVFAIEAPEVKFGDAPRTDSWAQALGFATPAVSEINSVATYADRTDNSKLLKIGITSQKAEIVSNYLNNITLISTKHKGEDAAKLNAERLVKVFSLNALAYPVDKIKYIKYKIDGGTLVEANELSAVNLIQVNYGRGDLDKIPVVYPKFGETKVWVLTSNNSFVAANIDITRIQDYKFSTYPLKGIARAFEELKSGKVIYNKEFNGTTFDIRDVKLAYLDTYAYQPYLQPVYLFEGNDGLAAYVNAVSDSFISTEKN